MNYIVLFLGMIATIILACGAFALLLFIVGWSATKIEHIRNPFVTNPPSDK